MTELSRLLEPSTEFVKLALQNIESRNLTPAVVENWKPILRGAIQQWAKQRSLAEALESPSSLDVNDTANAAGKIVTTQQEIEAFAVVARLLGPEFPCAYEEAVAYFKVHVSQRRTWVFARLNMDRRTPLMWVPLPEAQVALHAGSRALTFSSGWTSVALNGAADLEHLKDLLVSAYTAINGETT